MKSMLKDAAILFAITLIAGLLLGGVYQITKEPIAQQEALALQKACKEVFAAADSFETAADFDAAHAQEVLAGGGYTAQTVEGYQIAVDAQGNPVGFVLTVVTHEGYGGDIRFTMGVNTDGSLNGISLLNIAETPGLGMQAEEVLVPQFADKNAYPFAYVKTGKTAENQIDAISGATITTEAITEGVNAGLYYFMSELDTRTEGGAGHE